MAFNQASLFLFPPKYGPEVEFDHSATMASGEPLAIISSLLVDSSAPRITTGDVQEWFMNRGFSEKERYGGSQVLFRDRCATFLGSQEVIDLTLSLDEEELQELRIRFLLTEKVPDVAAWKDLILELGNDFGFRLMGEGHQLLPCVDFLTVLRGNWNFRTFEKNFKWTV